MSVYQWLCVLGIPTLVVSSFGLIIGQFKQLKALKLGMQAILRDRLLQAYKFYDHIGHASYEDKSNIQNIYTQYEALGPNGIMERKHFRFLELPEEANDNDNEGGTQE